jgi:hypothetical protein
MKTWVRLSPLGGLYVGLGILVSGKPCLRACYMPIPANAIRNPSHVYQYICDVLQSYKRLSKKTMEISKIFFAQHG